MIKKNKIHLIDFNEKKNQMLLVEYLFKANYKFDNIDVKKEFTNYTKNKIILSDKEISYIKSKIFGKFKNLSLLECVKKISVPNQLFRLKFN